MFVIAILLLLLYVHLGWCWSDALLRLDASKPHLGRNYLVAFVLWPMSMIMWDASQQEDEIEEIC